MYVLQHGRGRINQKLYLPVLLLFSENCLLKYLILAFFQGPSIGRFLFNPVRVNDQKSITSSYFYLKPCIFILTLLILLCTL